MYRITGKTYAAREYLKKVGATYTGKDWIIEDRAPVDAMIKKLIGGFAGTAGWTIAKGLQIEEFANITCEI